jgi:hypothetical protein
MSYPEVFVLIATATGSGALAAYCFIKGLDLWMPPGGR